MHREVGLMALSATAPLRRGGVMLVALMATIVPRTTCPSCYGSKAGRGNAQPRRLDGKEGALVARVSAPYTAVSVMRRSDEHREVSRE